jgi:hypothetical protein
MKSLFQTRRLALLASLPLFSVEHEKVTKHLLIEFPNNVAREDMYTVALKDGTARFTDWNYRTGTAIHSQCKRGERSLFVKNTKNESYEACFETKGLIVGKRLEATTRNVKGSTIPMAIWGHKVLSPAKTISLMYNAGLSSNTTDSSSSSLITNSHNSTVSTTQIQDLGTNSISVFSTTLNGKGHQRHSTVNESNCKNASVVNLCVDSKIIESLNCLAWQFKTSKESSSLIWNGLFKTSAYITLIWSQSTVVDF